MREWASNSCELRFGRGKSRMTGGFYPPPSITMRREIAGGTSTLGVSRETRATGGFYPVALMGRIGSGSSKLGTR